MAERQTLMHLPGANYIVYEAKGGVSAETVAKNVHEAMRAGEVIDVDVLNENGQVMKVYVNGGVVGFVTFGFGLGPVKPGEVG